jgi:hypothetical protein
MLYTHLSFGAGTIGQLVADVPSGLSLTPPQEINKKGNIKSLSLYRHYYIVCRTSMSECMKTRHCKRNLQEYVLQKFLKNSGGEKLSQGIRLDFYRFPCLRNEMEPHGSSDDFSKSPRLPANDAADKDKWTGRAIAQAVTRRFPTAAARVRGRFMSCGICGGQSGIGASFLRVLLFPLPICIPLIAPQSSSSFLIWGWYTRPNSGRSTKWTQSHPVKKN